jgi:hypothetical protein
MAWGVKPGRAVQVVTPVAVPVGVGHIGGADDEVHSLDPRKRTDPKRRCTSVGPQVSQNAQASALIERHLPPALRRSERRRRSRRESAHTRQSRAAGPLQRPAPIFGGPRHLRRRGDRRQRPPWGGLPVLMGKRYSVNPAHDFQRIDVVDPGTSKTDFAVPVRHLRDTPTASPAQSGW